MNSSYDGQYVFRGDSQLLGTQLVIKQLLIYESVQI